jgi:hypothetical protein
MLASWAQGIFLPWPPKQLELQVHITAPNTSVIFYNEKCYLFLFVLGMEPRALRELTTEPHP